jgi:hypothetical protein
MMRANCISRLHGKSPKRSFEDEARWTTVRDAYCFRFRTIAGFTKDANIGPAFVKHVNKVLKQLGEHYGDKTTYNKDGKKGGDPQAFESFFRKMEKSIPKPASAVTL